MVSDMCRIYFWKTDLGLGSKANMILKGLLDPF